MPWRRVTTMPGYYTAASLSETVADRHAQFSMGKAAVRAWLADGFFGGTVDALFTSVFSLLAMDNYISMQYQKTHLRSSHFRRVQDLVNVPPLGRVGQCYQMTPRAECW